MASAFKSYRILVVDDQEQICSLLAKMIEGMGHIAVTAPNGRDALNLFQKETFHLVITDFNMPELDGATLTSSIKQQTPGMPVFVLTGAPERLAGEIPADIILAKPFSLNALKKEMVKFLPASEQLPS